MRPWVRALGLTAGAALPLAAAALWTMGALSAPDAADAAAGDGGREIAVRVYAWGFRPSVIRVRPGQRIRFAVESDDIQHGFAINELGVNLPLAPGRVARSPEIAVSLPEGTYTIHCSAFCGLGHPSMKGRLVVGTPGPPPGARAPWLASLLAVAVAVGGAAVAARGGRARRP